MTASLRVASAQLPPWPDTDDRLVVTSNAVIVLDGATAREPTPVSTHQYVASLGDALRDLLDANPLRDLRRALSCAIAQTAAELNLVAGHSPSSTVSIIRAARGTVDVLVLGDSPVVIGTTHGVREITDARLAALDLPQRAEYRKRLEAGSGYDDVHRQLLAAIQRDQTAVRNTLDGYWIAEADPVAAEQAVVARREIADVRWCLLCTDGAEHPIKHLGLDDWAGLATSSSSQLEAVLQTCWRWEADVDPNAAALPRAKRHDDKSIAALVFQLS